MVTLYVISTEAYWGKTLACLALGTRWRKAGLRVGYMKPLGLRPIAVGEEVTDEDTLFVAEHFGFRAAPAHLCPVILDAEAYRADPAAARAKVEAAFQAISLGKEVMLLGGLGEALTCGSALGLAAPAVAELLGAKVLLIARAGSLVAIDAVIAVQERLGERLAGVVFNRVAASERPWVEREILPALAAHRAPVLGMLPDDSLLSSVTVGEIARATEGELLCGQDRCEQLVENFVVGAMGVESALRFFRRTARKCVITGGDRIDVQFAALETSTRCLILTGNLRPSHRVLARAMELEVPVVLVRGDTLSTVTVVEQLLGKQRVRETKKVEHALAQFEQHVDLARLEAALGLAVGTASRTGS